MNRINRELKRTIIIKKIYWILFILMILSFGCESPSEVPEYIEPTPYMSLNVGDIRQFSVVTEYSDRIVEYRKEIVISDTLKRTDGKTVYSVVETYLGSYGSLYKKTTYAFIKDGYYWETELDTVSNYWLEKDNPFREAKMTNIFPDGDEYFRQIDIEDEYNPDYNMISLIDSFTTPIKTFYNVQKCISKGYSISGKITHYYAPKYGLIGREEIYLYTDKLTLRYLKVNGEEIGEYVPLK